MGDQGVVTAAAIIIGNEILSGRTKDANLPYIAERLAGWGIQLMEARVVPDIEDEIVGAVNALRAKFDYVLTSGGIGPTHDDITAASIAKAFEVPLDRHEEAVRRLRRHYERPEDLTEARLRMANVPRGGVLIDNPVSAAPGFQVENVFVLAGVPRIMQAMIDGLQGRMAGGRQMHAVSITCALPESILAPGLGEIQSDYPDVSIGSYPHFAAARSASRFGVSIVLRGLETEDVEAASERVRDLMRSLGGTPENRDLSTDKRAADHA